MILTKQCQELKVGNTVYTKDFTPSSQKWIEGVIIDFTGPLSYMVNLYNGIEFM